MSLKLSYASFALSISSAEESACVPIFSFARSDALVTSVLESFIAIRTILLLRYLLERDIASCLSGVMDIPFHTQSIVPAFSSISFAFQSIGLNSTFIPISSATAVARSISKPISSPCSSLKPIGAKVSSRPTTMVSFSPSVSGVSLLPVHPVSASAEAVSTRTNASTTSFLFLNFIISNPPKFKFSLLMLNKLKHS